MAERIQSMPARKSKIRGPVKHPYYPDVILPRPCIWCKAEFVPIRDTAQFCSKTCRGRYGNAIAKQRDFEVAREKAKQRPIMSAADIGFLAGIVDGEGWIGLTAGDKAKGRPGSVRITVGMTDKDVIENLRTITGTGTVSRRNRKDYLPSGKEVWCWTASSKRDMARLLCAIASVPWLSARRRQRIAELAEVLSTRVRSR